MARYSITRGVFDILPEDTELWRQVHLWHYVEERARALCKAYHYHEVRTPLFETTDLFTQSIGTTSDIVKKEMFTFEDRGGRSLTLRPEGTAPVLRAFIEKNLAQQSHLHKFFYLYPLFRYERQQAGRYRQHHQFGVEAIGASSPFQDVEVILLLWTFYQALGLRDLTLHLHSIGDEEARRLFRDQLKEYLRPHLSNLSEESRERYDTNPLRILDSKAPEDKALLAEAPRMLELLGPASRAHFTRVCELLTEMGIPFLIDHRLVRGLDYYTDTVFEVTSDAIGAQNSLGGGGRYDGLLKRLGGPDLPSCGFGTGLERVLQTMIAQGVALPPFPTPLLMLLPLREAAKTKAFHLAAALRAQGYTVEIDLQDRKLKQALRYADQIHARFVLIIGEEELASGKAELKEMATGTSRPVLLDRLADALPKNS